MNIDRTETQPARWLEDFGLDFLVECELDSVYFAILLAANKVREIGELMYNLPKNCRLPGERLKSLKRLWRRIQENKEEATSLILSHLAIPTPTSDEEGGLGWWYMTQLNEGRETVDRSTDSYVHVTPTIPELWPSLEQQPAFAVTASGVEFRLVLGRDSGLFVFDPEHTTLDQEAIRRSIRERSVGTEREIDMDTMVVRAYVHHTKLDLASFLALREWLPEFKLGRPKSHELDTEECYGNTGLFTRVPSQVLDTFLGQEAGYQLPVKDKDAFCEALLKELRETGIPATKVAITGPINRA